MKAQMHLSAYSLLKVNRSYTSKWPLCVREIFTVKWVEPTYLLQVIKKASG